MRRWVRVGLPAAAGGLIAFGGLQAQQPSPLLRGRVLTAAGEPVAGQSVALHRVTAAGGATVAQATSGPDGRFELTVAGAADGALYFAATRYDGGIYIGTPFRLPAAAGREYTIVVGPGATDAAALLRGTLSDAAGPAPARDAQEGRAAGWPLVLAIAGAAAALALLGWRRTASRRMPARRKLLLELAELEERFEPRAGAVGTAEWDAYQRRRHTLRERLHAAAAG